MPMRFTGTSRLRPPDGATAVGRAPPSAFAADGPRAAPTPTATDDAASALSRLRRVIGLAETVGWWCELMSLLRGEPPRDRTRGRLGAGGPGGSPGPPVGRSAADREGEVHRAGCDPGGPLVAGLHLVGAGRRELRERHDDVPRRVERPRERR